MHKDTTLHFEMAKQLLHEPNLSIDSKNRIPIYAVMWFDDILEERYGSYFATAGGRFVYMYHVTSQGDRLVSPLPLISPSLICLSLYHLILLHALTFPAIQKLI